MKRFATTLICFVFLVVCFLLCFSLAENENGIKHATERSIQDVTSQSRISVDKGLAYLVSTQSKTGFWGRHYHVAVTSLAGLAFLAGGNMPGEGKYSESSKSALRYILKSATKMGFITESGTAASRMHGHGFATWFLAEIYGMTHHTSAVDHEELKSVIKRAIRVIKDSQSNEGGWYYQPQKGGDEGSVTVCIVQALRAARNAGIAVDKNVIERGVNYLKRSANPNGSFKYSVRGGGGGTFALTAGGVSSFCLYGMYDLPETKRGFNFMLKFKPGTSKNNLKQSYPYYSNFYATLAMHLGGDQYWDDWFPPLRDVLIQKQRSNGSWAGGADNEAYATAFACLILQIPYQYLPLFQK